MFMEIPKKYESLHSSVITQDYAQYLCERNASLEFMRNSIIFALNDKTLDGDSLLGYITHIVEREALDEQAYEGIK